MLVQQHLVTELELCVLYYCFLLVQDLVERDETVFELITSHYDIPIAILLGGGYHVRIHLHLYLYGES